MTTIKIQFDDIPAPEFFPPVGEWWWTQMSNLLRTWRIIRRTSHGYEILLHDGRLEAVAIEPPPVWSHPYIDPASPITLADVPAKECVPWGHHVVWRDLSADSVWQGKKQEVWMADNMEDVADGDARPLNRHPTLIDVYARPHAKPAGPAWKVLGDVPIAEDYWVEIEGGCWVCPIHPGRSSNRSMCLTFGGGARGEEYGRLTPILRVLGTNPREVTE